MFTRTTLFAATPLGPLQQEALLRRVDLPSRAADVHYNGGECLLLWLGLLLNQFQFLDRDQVDVLLQRMRKSVYTHGQRLSKLARGAAPTADDIPAQLVFCDSVRATWTGFTGFLDLQTGETAASAARRPMVNIAISLDEVFLRGYAHCRQLENA